MNSGPTVAFLSTCSFGRKGQASQYPMDANYLRTRVLSQEMEIAFIAPPQVKETFIIPVSLEWRDSNSYHMSIFPSPVKQQVQRTSGQVNFSSHPNSGTSRSWVVPVERQVMVIHEEQHFQESTRLGLRSPASFAAPADMHTDPIVPKLSMPNSSMWLFWPSESLNESEPQTPP